MCSEHCSETVINRQNWCQDCQEETKDDFESRFEDAVSLCLESLTADEMIQIQHEFEGAFA
jgi:hypothetical protein